MPSHCLVPTAPSSHAPSALEPGGPLSPHWWEQSSQPHSCHLNLWPGQPWALSLCRPHGPAPADGVEMVLGAELGWCWEQSWDRGISLRGKYFRTGVLSARAAPTAFSQMCLAGVPGARWGHAKGVSPTGVCAPLCKGSSSTGLAQCRRPRAATVWAALAGTGCCGLFTAQ